MSQPVPAGGPTPLAALAVTAGAHSGRALSVPLPVVTVGRAPACEVVVDDDSVSDRHARLAYEAGGWSVTDLGSTNGTAVEGTRLEPNVAAPLPFGAALRLGGVRLRFEEVAEADPETARAAYVPPAAPKTLREERSGARFPVWLLLLLAVIAAVIAMLLYTQLAAPPAAAPGAAAWEAPRLPAAAVPLP
jgi:hypothetical protein